MKSSMRYLLPLALFLGVVVFLFKGLSLNPREVPSPLVGKDAPDFDISQLHNSEARFSKEEMLGKVWLLNVWASWCVACRHEHPVLVELEKQNIVPIYGLNYKDSQQDGIRWLRQFGNPYVLSGQDPDGDVGFDYGVYGVPETYLIDKEGIIRHKFIGPVVPDDIEQIIRPMVQELSL